MSAQERDPGQPAVQIRDLLRLAFEDIEVASA